MLNEPEIQVIMDEHNTGTIGYKTDVKAAAKAIAARLTLPHRMSEFVGRVNLIGGSTRSPTVYRVPGWNGVVFSVEFYPSGSIQCWSTGALKQSCSTGNCPHVQAVELYLARQEATK